MSTTVDFAIEHEAWNVYQLDDGSRIKVRVVLTGVRRRAEAGPNGQPVYECDTANLISTDAAPAPIVTSARPDRKDTA